MAKIELKHLSKEESRETIEFLNSHYSSTMHVKGTIAEIESISDRDLRTAMKKFFHSSGKGDYRIVSETGYVEVLPPKPEPAHIKLDKKTSAPVTSTMPYYFQDTTVIKPPRKKK